MQYTNTQKTADLFKGQKWVLGTTKYGRAILVVGRLICCSKNVTKENVGESLISICHLDPEDIREGQKPEFLLIHCPGDLSKVMTGTEGTGIF